MAQELKVVVPTHNRVDLLRRTLDSLAGCRLPAIYSGTIVVENSPRQLAHDIVEACPETLRARYLYVSRPNKSHALNEALAEVPDETLIYFIDDDIRLSTNVLDNYAKAAEGIDGGVFFGGPFRVDCEQDPPQWLLKYLPDSARGWEPAPEEIDPASTYYIGFNWAAFAGDIRRAGGFDTRFGPGGTTGGAGQETNMQQRLYLAGVRSCYVPGAWVWHYVPAQRCTPSWAIQRWHRTSITDGLARPVNEGGGLLFGVPRHKYRKLLRYWWRYAVARFHRDEEKSFQARFELTRFSGLLKGMRKAYRERHLTSQQ